MMYPGKYRGIIVGRGRNFNACIVRLDKYLPLPFGMSDLVVVRQDCPGRLDVIRHAPVSYRKVFLWFKAPVQEIVGQYVDVEVRPGIDAFIATKVYVPDA